MAQAEATYYYIATHIPEQGNALTKARKDVETLAGRRGMKPIRFLAENTAEAKLHKQIKLAFCALLNCITLLSTPKNSVILVQYPLQPQKTAYLFRRAFAFLRRRKGCRFIALIHDLDSARALAKRTAVFSDTVFLRDFDCVICHNERMKAYLVERGFDPQRLIGLGIFDYLYAKTPALPQRAYTPSVNVAANLAPEKSGYVYRLLQDAHTTCTLHLYGPGYVPPAEISCTAAYHGVIPAEALATVMEGAFGLVWDGAETETCTGGYGAYLRLNNPHKASLYLSCGMPVIIWTEAALAPLILENGAGLAVSSLDALSDILAGIDSTQYRTMAQNAAALAARIQNGDYFNAAMDAATVRLNARPADGGGKA